jgi:hypothetical protein
MIFTVELGESIGRSFRLQKDSTWRRLGKDYLLLESDFQTSNPLEVANRTPYETELEIEGTLYKISPASGKFGEILSGGSRVYRKNFPDVMPSKEQLRAVIAAGDDEQTNSLILNLQGRFELRQRPPFDIHKNDPTVVLRHEIFAAGNDYVGLEAAQDDDHIDRLFLSSLEGWLNHLTTGKTQEYSNLPSSTSYEQIQEEIELLRSRWTPFY